MQNIDWKFLLVAVLLILSMGNRKGKSTTKDFTSDQTLESTQNIVESASTAESPVAPSSKTK